MKKPFQKKSNFPAREVKEYEEEVIEIKRVTRVVKGGRRLRFRATVVIGNRNGKIGIGVGKSTEVTGAIQKAISQARKTIVQMILDEGTIPHAIRIKYKSSRLMFMPAGPGTGLIAGGTMRKILDLAGVKNILSKSLGSSNKLCNTYATYNALKKLQETPFMVMKKAKRKLEADKKHEAQKLAPQPVQKDSKPAAKSAVKPAVKQVAKAPAKKEVKSNNTVKK